MILSLVNTELGGWPILQGSTWDNSSFNFSHLLLKLNEYSSSIIYNIGTQIDDQNSSLLGIQVKKEDCKLASIMDVDISDQSK